MLVARDVELRSGAWRAVVAPDRGGRLRWFGSVKDKRRDHWIRPLYQLPATRDTPARPHEGGCGVLLARPGDVALHDLPCVPAPASIDEPWQLIARQDDRVTLMHHHRGPDPGSWSYQASQTLQLGQQRLEWTLAIRNLGRLPMLTRMGWHFHLPDEFSHDACLDAALPMLHRPPRGRPQVCEDWGGVASLGGSDGRFILLRGPTALKQLILQRPASGPWLRLDLLTADVPQLDPLQRGEERLLHLTVDLMHAQVAVTS